MIEFSGFAFGAEADNRSKTESGFLPLGFENSPLRFQIE
jgi:hypothetical protein